MPYVLSLSPIAKLSAVTDIENVVAFNAGCDGTVYIVLALEPTDYRTEQLDGPSFAKTVPDALQSYRVIAFREGRLVIDISISDEKFNIHDIQPLPRDEILLVCGRSHYRSSDDFEKNGRIYSLNGDFVREILLGDGIASVQATLDGTIWTSFFDEGIFGNFGWKEPVGASGLVAWTPTGDKVYDFRPTAGLDSICDCYALNVESDTDVWLYYYTEFPLVRLHRKKVQSVWDIPISGSSSFAVSGDRVLFKGGYDDRDLYYLFALHDGGKVEQIKQFQLVDQAGCNIDAQRVVGRGSSLYVLSDGLT